MSENNKNFSGLQENNLAIYKLLSILITDQILYILQDFDFYYSNIVLLSSVNEHKHEKAEG